MLLGKDWFAAFRQVELGKVKPCSALDSVSFPREVYPPGKKKNLCMFEPSHYPAIKTVIEDNKEASARVHEVSRFLAYLCLISSESPRAAESREEAL